MNKLQTSFSQREAAIYLNIHNATIIKYRRLGYFNPISLKGLLLYSKAELDGFNKKYLYSRKKTAK